MSTTYLSLVNSVLTRLNEVNLSSTTFAGATGFQAAVKEFVNASINDINNAELQWPFYFTQSTLTLSANSTTTQTYTLDATANIVDIDSFFIKPVSTTISSKALGFINYDKWLGYYQDRDASVMNNAAGWGKPDYVFQLPTNALKVGFTPVPDAAYVVSYNFWNTPVALSVYTDTTVIPDRYAHVIIDGAMYYAYMFRDNTESVPLAEKKFQQGISRMRTELLNLKQDMVNDVLIHGGGINNAFRFGA